MTPYIKARIKSDLVMLRYHVDEADPEAAEFLYRELMREVGKLAARFPIGNDFKVPVSLRQETVIEFAAGRKSTTS